MSTQALTLTQTTIGKKALMAVSGVVMVLFVIGHLSGNLTAFDSPRAFNEYAAFLRTLGPLLWVARIAILVSFLVHVKAAMDLWQRNKQAGAGASRYRGQKKQKTDWAALSMYLSGPGLLFYILFHLAHLTFGPYLFSGNVFGVEGYTFDEMNPYNNMVLGFQVWWISALYIVGVIGLGIHLSHGVWSMFQTIGANHPRYNRYRDWVAIGIAALLSLGFIAIPVAVLTGALQPSTETFYFPELKH
ncbi:MAG: succinate dehydrogenase cytochrome b subunit [Myxococcota bacterium]